jgi:citrate synthase
MEETCEIEKNIGLRGITIADTKVGDVDGNAGRLIYRGYLITDLANKASYEEVVHLLLREKLPDHNELASFNALLVAERPIPPGVLGAMRTFPKTAVPMDVLQAGVALLAHHDPDLMDTSREANGRKAARLVAKLPTVVAAWERIRQGKEPVEPNPDLGHAANFLYMLYGKPADGEVAKYFDTAMVLHAEHGFNASTFAAREVASTRAHMYAAVSAAIGSLSGDLHGGANARVMQMLLEIGTPDRVQSYVETRLKAGEKIMGLGHAVYNVDDPRAHILAPMSKAVGQRFNQPQWYNLSRLLEKKVKEEFRKLKGRDIPVNVDFYSASLYYAMGIPIDLFTPVFAMARVAGWTAHIMEEQFAEAAPKPMLYRPESEYVGHYCGPEVCSFVPIEER